MNETAVERRLAAIMAADVVGYSRLMGGDEVGTLRALRTHRSELIDPTIASRRGRIWTPCQGIGWHPCEDAYVPRSPAR